MIFSCAGDSAGTPLDLQRPKPLFCARILKVFGMAQGAFHGQKVHLRSRKHEMLELLFHDPRQPFQDLEILFHDLGGSFMIPEILFHVLDDFYVRR